MVVDDHQLVRDGIKSLLSDIKNIIVVGEAGNGKEATEKLGSISVDIVLMDVEMPLMNGWDATETIVSQYPDTKVIALTTFSEKAIVHKMINAGASGYILKNSSKEMLVEAINNVFEGRQHFSSEISLALLKLSAEETIKPKKTQSSLHLLTAREVEILRLIAQGMSNNEIADKLFISNKTVKAHRENIMQKLNLHNVVGLVRFAIDNELID